MGKFTTGTGQNLDNVHEPGKCAGQHCVIHNPSDHHMKDLPTHWRVDRRIMERLCTHGIGHPDPDEINPNTTHGCDGCCTNTEIFAGYTRSGGKSFDLAHALWNAVHRNPQQRLGQLLINLARDRDLWNIRDEEWIRLLNGADENVKK